MRLAVVTALLASACATLPKPAAPPAGALNVVMIVVDDLRPFIGAYGAAARTPNIDALVARGALFQHAYCQQTLCNPSRSSLLTGRRPDTLRVRDQRADFRRQLPGVVTLPQFFKRLGYRAIALGKVFQDGALEDAQSWSEPVWHSPQPQYGDPATRAAIVKEAGERAARGEDASGALGPSWQAADVSDDQLRDGGTAAYAVATLRRLAAQPFFLAVGFSRPHLPFVAPRRYYDLYPLDAVATAANPFPPSDAPPVALVDSGELRLFPDIPREGPLPPEKERELVRGYYASVSYIDAQIGRVLDGLDALGLADRTVVLLWGDHGFHLGEHGIWCKATVFEVAARAPLIVRAPGQRAPGAKIDALVELVDVYPSVAELAHLPPPAGVEGVSFAPLLADPERSWKRAAFTEQPRGDWFGRSMRTERYRYTEWLHRGDGAIARELYDHRDDDGENANLAERPELRAVVEQLAAQLHQGWRAAAPERAAPASKP